MLQYIPHQPINSTYLECNAAAGRQWQNQCADLGLANLWKKEKEKSQ